MAIDEQGRQELANSLQKVFEKYANEEPDAFARPDLGQMSFQALRPSITGILDTSRRILAAPYRDLPVTLIQKAMGAIGNMEARFNELRTFNVFEIGQRNQNPVTLHAQYVAQFDQAEIQFWEQITPIVGYLLGLKLERSPEATGEITRTVLREAQAAVQHAQQSREELNQIVNAARDAAADVGVTQHAVHFKEEAETHRSAARNWLYATIVAAGLTLLALGTNLVYSLGRVGPVTAAANVQLVLAKLLAFSLLITGTVWCGRMYRASRHNEVVNRHRQNALSSFQTFVKAATDDQTKNAVLLHAAQSIFVPQASGFVAAESEPVATSHLVEMVRTVSQPTKT